MMQLPSRQFCPTRAPRPSFAWPRWLIGAAGLLVSSNSVVAQTASVPPPRVLSSPLADTLSSAAFDALADRTRFSGVIVDRYPDGRLRLSRTVQQGLAYGFWSEWYPSGVPRYLAEWFDGKGEGLWLYLHESGVVRARYFLKGDRSEGPSEGWHPSGVKAYEGFYDANRQVGRWRWWNTSGILDSSRVYGGWKAAEDTLLHIFAPGIVSTGDAEVFGLALAPDGREAFVTRRRPGETQRIERTQFVNGQWTPLERAPFSTAIDESPAFSANGQTVYFASRRPRGQPSTSAIRSVNSGDESDNLWAVTRTENGWGTPKPLRVNRSRARGDSWPVASELHPSIATDGSLWFWTQRDRKSSPDLYRAAPMGDDFAAPVMLPSPVNTPRAEASPAIGSDGAVVFQAFGRRGGAGGEDLFVSWPTRDGWTDPVPLPVNTASNEYMPTFSSDREVLFFASDRALSDGTTAVYYVRWRSLRLSKR